MIKQQEEWVFANYIWNEDQTNAVLNMNGGYKSLSWNENSEEKSVNYRIPSAAECLVCHKKNNAAMPIGTKPQNLNLNFSYPEGNKNQLQKLIEAGYLEDDIPTNLAETIMWEDASASLEKRARAYLDVNCAHCHSAGGHCDYVPIKLNLSEEDLYNSGVCMEPVTYFPGGPFVINSGNAHASEMYLRMNSNAVDVMMPIMGRSMIHEEGVQLIEDWINSIETTCE